ncbi:MAG TPA: phospholipase [Bacteroidetes bacterium]|nr:phospholipase [Bacteroidota bacterium]
MKNFSNKKYLHTSAQLVRSGEEYFNTLAKLIEESRHEILFHTYILENDETGKKILHHLTQAVNRGVQVSVLLDAFGSGNLDKNFFRELSLSGIRVRRFEPFFNGNKFHIGRRLHHKVFVADEECALVSGINISNRYHGIGEKEWLDFAVMVRGNICHQLASICRSIEDKNFFRRNRKVNLLPAKNYKNLMEVLARVRQTDWVRGKNQIRTSYRKGIRSSEHTVFIIASYFIPGVSLRRALYAASKRGVQIKILLAEKSDVPFAKGATEYLYDWMLRSNIRVFEYQPSVVHAKVMAIDNEWMTIGSYNLNNLSEYSSIELNIDIASESFTRQFTAEVEKIISTDCIEITLNEFSRHGLFRRMSSWFSYQFMRLNFSILFFLQSKSKQNQIE